MKTKYLIRLDDACPTMDKAKWDRMESILDNYGVKPLVGVIPHNEDPMQMIDKEDPDFWIKVKQWEAKGWAIALHGYNHCYISDKGMEGLNPLWSRSEFAGVSLGIQKEKIKKGIVILRANGIISKYFFAPSHTYDSNTLKALKEESDIRIISDTIATKPYSQYGFIFIPQFGGHCINIKYPGVWTFCFHPSTMNGVSFGQLEYFLSEHHKEFGTFDTLDLSNLSNKDLISCAFSKMYFFRRKLMKIK